MHKGLGTFLKVAVRVVAGVCVLAAFAPAVATEARKPNIVILLADDLGYGDLGCYGNKQIQTPNLDRLAAEGMRFTAFYAAHATCSPSRFGMQCGRVPYRAGIFNYIPLNSEMQLGRDDETLGDICAAAGYDTGFFGKWGLNGAFGRGADPTDHGFGCYLAAQNNGKPSHQDPIDDKALPKN